LCGTGRALDRVPRGVLCAIAQTSVGILSQAACGDHQKGGDRYVSSGRRSALAKYRCLCTDWPGHLLWPCWCADTVHRQGQGRARRVNGPVVHL